MLALEFLLGDSRLLLVLEFDVGRNVLPQFAQESTHFGVGEGGIGLSDGRSHGLGVKDEGVGWTMGWIYLTVLVKWGAGILPGSRPLLLVH
jgi:hypothetical protein